jgi:hypothetical protein
MNVILGHFNGTALAVDTILCVDDQFLVGPTLFVIVDLLVDSCRAKSLLGAAMNL